MSSESPYTTPQSSLLGSETSELYGYKRYVIQRSDIEWPPRCYKCNADTSVTKKVKLTYVNPWIYLSLLITPIFTIILALIFQKKFTVQLPLCETHLKKRRYFSIFQWVAVSFMIAGFIIGIATNSDIALILSIALILVIVVSAIAGRMVYIAKFKKDNLWVRGAGKEFVSSLSSFNN